MNFWPFNWRKRRAEKARMFQAAQFGRLVQDWITASTSADSELKGSLRALRNRSRQLERDNDFVRGFLREVEVNVIGLGIPFQAQVKMQRGDRLNEAVNANIEEAWDKWSRADSCHVAGLLSFPEIERLSARSAAKDGEFYIRMIRSNFGKSKIPLALELLEADLLAEEYAGQAANGNEIRMGVEVNQWGRRTAYYFHQRHPGDFQFPQGTYGNNRNIMRVPAEEIIPLFICERAGQTRGIPWYISSMTRMRHISGYEEATVIGARAAASLMGFIQSPDGELKGDDVESGERVTDFQPGIFKYLQPGETVNVPNLNRPNGEYDPFMRSQLRAFATGSGSSYESISSDFSQTNYSSSRQALLKERDYYRIIQQWIVTRLHQTVFENWLDMAVLSGELTLPGYEIQPERYQKLKWMPRGWAWVDPLKEVTAYKEAVRSGMSTLSNVVAQNGSDIEELFHQRRRELDLANELGLSLDSDPAFVPAKETISDNIDNGDPTGSKN